MSRTLDENIVVAQLRDLNALMELQGVEAILAVDGPLSGRGGCHYVKLCVLGLGSKYPGVSNGVWRFKKQANVNWRESRPKKSAPLKTYKHSPDTNSF